MINNHFADIILPLAVKGIFTYRIPQELNENISVGSRVLVQFGDRKLYSGIVNNIHTDSPSGIKIRPVISVLDPFPIVNKLQLNLWFWISEYYMCTIGEVMKAALPSDLCLEGVTSLPVSEKYKPREKTYVNLASSFSEIELNSILDKLARSPKQYEILVTFLEQSHYKEKREIIPVEKATLIKGTRSSQTILKRLVEKNILTFISRPAGRLKDSVVSQEPLKVLSTSQKNAFDSIKAAFLLKQIALLHGVTSSGKTEIFIHLIEEQLKEGKQILYLLPEIALTSQIVHRLNRHFSHITGVYHSRFSSSERVEIWDRVAGKNPGREYKLIIGARSALFLPFHNLGLVIVDEEQDASYKQTDPAPRYNARDTAIMLAGFHTAKTVLGSASPSLESYFNALSGKYGLVTLKERFGSVRLPEIIVANTREAYRKKLMVSHFSPELLDTIDEALGNNEQVILFQNRRGFSPFIECAECGWIPRCIRCAVSLTYHKSIGKMVCHYCGFTSVIPSSCNNCHSPGLVTRGFGTERIEDEIKIVFPSAKVARMDQDTTKGKNSFTRLLKALEEKQIDILIGTQMISKGLDIENLTVVGILNADNLLNYPDFRAYERSFQMLEQVSGRAGRRQKPGKVVIQTTDPGNRIIRLVLNHDYVNMFRLQAEERRAFNYPPYCRLIKINIKHKDRALVNNFSELLANDLRSKFKKGVLGPQSPVISQIQLWYIKTILLKIERESPVTRAKQIVSEAVEKLEKTKGASALRISIDVDPN